jgi:hypothetical protein
MNTYLYIFGPINIRPNEKLDQRTFGLEDRLDIFLEIQRISSLKSIQREMGDYVSPHKVEDGHTKFKDFSVSNINTGMKMNTLTSGVHC